LRKEKGTSKGITERPDPEIEGEGRGGSPSITEERREGGKAFTGHMKISALFFIFRPP